MQADKASLSHPHLALSSSQNPISPVWQISDEYIRLNSPKLLALAAVPAVDALCWIYSKQCHNPQEYNSLYPLLIYLSLLHRL